MPSIRAVVAAASCDSFFLVLKWPVLSFLIGYVAVAATQRSSTVPIADGQSQYESPEALRMTLLHPFDNNVISIHYVAGMLLILFTVAQKLTVPALLRSNAVRRFHTTLLGPAISVLIGAMAFAGFALRQDSAFTNFDSAMIAFVAPWVVLLASVGLTAKMRWLAVHAILGDAVFKACVAVPLARVTGAALQRCTAAFWQQQRVIPLRWTSAITFTDESGYYYGILLATVLTTLWAIVDVYFFIRRLRRADKTI